MSILKGHVTERLGAPYDLRGQFVPRQCPVDGCDGTLRPDGPNHWACDGLLDPNDENKELQPCRYSHHNGEPAGEPNHG